MCTRYAALLTEVTAVTADTQVDGLSRLSAVARLLWRQVDGYDWVGWYFAVHTRRELVLGPFWGEPTDHVRIPFGVGICGQAVVGRSAFVVPDVSAQDNYLACSLKVRSEIVVPVFYGERVVAELDIDSHRVSAFTADDEQLLTAVAALCAPLVPSFEPEPAR